MLLAALALALWALVRLGPTDAATLDGHGAHLGVWGERVVQHTVLSVCVIVVAVGGTAVACRVRADAGPGLFPSSVPAALAGVGLALVLYDSEGLPTVYRMVMAEYPIGHPVGVVTAAWALAGLGCLFLLVGAPAIRDRSKLGSLAARVGVVLGASAAVVVTLAGLGVV